MSSIPNERLRLESDTSRTLDGNSNFTSSMDTIHSLRVSESYSGQPEGQRNGEAQEPREQRNHEAPSACSADENKEIVITAIRVTDVALGLRRLPAGFYIVLRSSGLQWRTEVKPSSVNDDVVEWNGPISVSSDPEAIMCLEVYASFEFQPMLGCGEQLRTLTMSVKQLLDLDARSVPFTFFVKDGDVVSPCSSILVAIERQKRENNEPSTPRARGPQWSTPETEDQLEGVTNNGHNALSRYRKHRGAQDLERSIQQFERAIGLCPPDHPCRAVVQSNLAMTKLIQYQVDHKDASLETVLRLYRNVLAARPVGHPDRPSTLIHLSTVHLARFWKWRERADEVQARALLHEAVELAATASHENRVATFMRQQCVGCRPFPVQPEAQSLVEQNSISCFTDSGLEFSTALLGDFDLSGNLACLQQAIAILEELARCTLVRDGSYRTIIGNLGGALSRRFLCLGRFCDLDDAISKLREVITLTSDGYLGKPGFLGNLGNSLKARFDHLGELSDLDDAISTFRDAVRLAPQGCLDKPAHLGNLGVSLTTRFHRLGRLGDLEEAISVLGDALRLNPRAQLHQFICFSGLSNCFDARFKRFGQLSDLHDSISMLRRAIEFTPHVRSQKHSCLNNLGTSLKTRFNHLGQLSDLDEAISLLRDATDLIPDGRPDKPVCLSNLGNCFITRFERLGQLSDLDDAIRTLSDAVDLFPRGHPSKLVSLSSLGTAFVARFQRLGQLIDLENGISMLKNALNLTPHDFPDKFRHLNDLGNSFSARFSRLGELSDLEEAISRQKEAVELLPDSHPEKPGALHNLGASFLARFERLGRLGDLENAISTYRHAVDLTPDGNPHKPRWLNGLGTSLFKRFGRLREGIDLEDAIPIQQDAVDLTPPEHPDKPGHLLSLGISFITRFQHLGQQGDLENAISRLEDSVKLIPHDHPARFTCLHTLGNALTIRFERLGGQNYLDDAISVLKLAVELTPKGHPHLASHLYALGNSLKTRFECLGQLDDLEDAISLLKDAAHLIPHGDPHKPACLSSLASSFVACFERLGQVRNLEYAISLYSHAASSPIGPVHDRFQASRNWISCARRARHRSLLRAHSVSLRLLPQLAWIGLSLPHRFSELARAADVVREAAAAALDSGLPEMAVEWLEQGRSIVWGELLQLRSSHQELSSIYPNHAQRLHELSTALDNAGSAHERSLSALSEQTQGATRHAIESLQREADKHRALAIERDKLLHEIRRLPGFEQFLLRKPFSQLRGSAHAGPVVMLNVAENRCDALIVLASLDHVIHVPLPALTLKRTVDLHNSLKGVVRHARTGSLAPQGSRWEAILSPVWKSIVRPVLDALAFQSTPIDLSRIFWCPTGPLTFVPIHAAGLYHRQYSEPGHKVFDFVVSSYVPTLSVLLGSPNLDATPSTGDLRLLAVRQPPSDGLAPLPGVTIELDRIKDVIERSPLACTTLLEPSDGTVEEILALMKKADWVHFACHGAQDGLDSGQCLANQRRLKLRDIVALSRPRDGLAFLSACETARGDKHLSDEALHMAAGMLFAGYGGVVGSMWSIDDRVAPDVARDIYAKLLRKGTRPDYREVALALHEATGRLRNRGMRFDEWVPFIHVGL